MNISELTPLDLVALDSPWPVKLLGKATNEELHLFHACAAFPWRSEQELTIAERFADRQQFVDRVAQHADKVSVYRLERRGGSLASTTLSTESVCTTIAPVRRFTTDRKK
jgi:hypothetical protein